MVWAPSTSAAKAYYTKDRGATWLASRLIGVTAGDFLHPRHYLKREGLAADPLVAGTFYAIGGNDVSGDSMLWKTTDGGATFEKVVAQGQGMGRPGYWDFRFNSHLVAMPGRSGHLFALAGKTDDADHPYWHSTDGGRTWVQREDLRNAHSLGIGAPMTPGGNPTLFTYGKIGTVHGLYRSSDFGGTWTYLTDYVRGWHQSITAIVGDPEVPGKVYVGFVGGGFSVGKATTSSAPTTPAPAPTTPAPAPPTTAPTPTNPAPAPTTPAPAPTTPAPAPPTTAPTPTNPAPAPTCGTRGKKNERCPRATTFTVSATTTQVRFGTPVKLATRISPARAGQLVSLERKVGRSWVPVATTRTTATGAASFNYRQASRGTTTLRFVTKSGEGPASVSRSFDMRRA